LPTLSPALVIALSAFTSDMPVTPGTPAPLSLPVRNLAPTMATASTTMTAASVTHGRALRRGAATGAPASARRMS